MGNMFASIQNQQRESAREKNILSYDFYKKNLLDIGLESKEKKFNRKFSQRIVFRDDLKEDSSCEYISISPELSVIWDKIRKEKDTQRCIDITNQLLERPYEEGGCQKIAVKKIRESLEELAEEGSEELAWMWFATTQEGVDIRSGLADEENPESKILGDDCVHALMAGRTGSGKSNALHVVISSLMYQYAPWELNINLADFKIVEMSKYGSGYYTENGKTKLAAAPHVCKIAATDSMEYVLSVMYDMYEKMDIRQKVFAALGIQKLSQYRKKFNVVLPREILIVDEFQQMYELATAKQAETINQLIKMITKLGRATGYHLLFASQSMSGTVRNDVLANFKLRLCLPANEEISSMVLGNKAAAEFTGSKSKGYLMANDEGGGVDFNTEFKIPLMREGKNESAEDDLTKVLRENAKLAEKIGYKKELDFYREDVTRELYGGSGCYEYDLDRFLLNTKETIEREEEIESFLLLGDSCVYAKKPGKNNTLEYSPLKIGDRKNILCVADGVAQRAYLLQLLSLTYEKRAETNINYMIHGDPIVKNLINWREDFIAEEVTAKDITKKIISAIKPRLLLQKFTQYPKEEQTPERLRELVFNENYIALINKGIKDLNGELKKQERVPEITSYSQVGWLQEKYKANQRLIELLEHCQSQVEKGFGEYWKMYQKGLGTDGQFRFKGLKTITFWINGFHMLTDLLEEWSTSRAKSDIARLDVFKKCSSLGIRFIFIGAKVGELSASMIKNFGYYFILSNDETNYFKLNMQRPKEYKDNVIHFRAVNEALNRQKPGLYILMQDEKIVKMYETDNNAGNSLEETLFKGIESS